jgi:hypothetical protein
MACRPRGGGACRRANGTARYLPQERWGDIEGHGPRDNWPPAWKGDAALRVERLLTVPVENWTEDDARAVQASRLYWHSGNPRQAEAFEKVKRWFESSETRRRNQLRTSHGPVTVDPYKRGDGTKVDGHTRSLPANRRAGFLPVRRRFWEGRPGRRQA